MQFKPIYWQDLDNEILCWCRNADDERSLIRVVGYRPALQIYVSGATVEELVTKTSVIFSAIRNLAVKYPEVDFSASSGFPLHGFYEEKVPFIIARGTPAQIKTLSVNIRSTSGDRFQKKGFRFTHRERIYYASTRCLISAATPTPTYAHLFAELNKDRDLDMEGLFGATDWIELTDATKINQSEAISTVDHEYIVEWTGIGYCKRAPVDCAAAKQRIRVLSFDIEAHRQTITSFPNPSVDPTIMIACTFGAMHDPKSWTRHFIKWYNDWEVPSFDYELDRGDEHYDIETIIAEDESDMYAKFFELIQRLDPDMIAAHNCFGFDWKFILNRIDKLLIDVPSFSRLKGEKLERIAANMKSKARIVEGLAPTCNGRIIFDTLTFCKVYNFKLSSRAVGEVAEKFVGPNASKTGLSMSEFWKITDALFTTANRLNRLFDRDLSPIARIDELNLETLIDEHISRCDTITEGEKYCVIDAELVHRIIYKASMDSSVDSDVNVIMLSPLDVYILGQRARTALPRYIIMINKQYFVNAPLPAMIADKKYSGGIVLEPVCGIHHHVAVVDFCSLYPTIMIAYNISTDTQLRGAQIQRHEDKIQLRQNIEGVEIAFVKQDVRVGIVSYTEQFLLKWRTSVKRDKKRLTDENDFIGAMTAESKQLVIKVLCNSEYGLIGSPFDFQSLLIAAATVTNMARYWLDKIQQEGRSLGVKIVGGDTDSMFIHLPEVKDYDELIRRTEEVLRHINSILPPPMALELEKCGCIILPKKKNYKMALVWKDGRKLNDNYKLPIDDNGRYVKEFMEYKGESNKRSFTALSKINIETLEIGLIGGESIIDIARKIVANMMPLLTDEIDLDLLATSMGISAEAAAGTSKTNTSSKEFCRRMAESGRPMEAGSNARFFYCDVPGTTKKGERSFMYEDVKEGLVNYKIDKKHYIEDSRKKTMKNWRLLDADRLELLELKYSRKLARDVLNGKIALGAGGKLLKKRVYNYTKAAEGDILKEYWLHTHPEQEDGKPVIKHIIRNNYKIFFVTVKQLTETSPIVCFDPFAYMKKFDKDDKYLANLKRQIKLLN